MYLRDYLHDIPLKLLKAISGTLNVPVEYGARIKLLNAVDRAFWDGSLTERLIGELSDDSRRILSLIAFSFEAGVHEKALLGKMERLYGMSHETTKSLLNALIPYALAGGVTENDNLYFCPRGVAEQVRKNLIGDITTFPESTGAVPLVTPPNVMEDIYAFLTEAHKESISLTLMGNVKKTFLDRVFNGSLTCTDPFLNLSEDHRNAFVIDYLKNRGLAVFDHRRVRAGGKLGEWLKLSSTDRYQDVVSFALSRVLQDPYTIVAFTGIVTELPAGAFFDASEFANFLNTDTMASDGFSRLEARVLELLTLLYHLGMFSYRNGRFVLTVTGERFFRGKQLPLDENTSDFFTVQPNFEVIAGSEIHPLIRFKLELLSDRKNRDMVLTYEVTQEGITRARERGMSTEEILSFFEHHSRNPLPQNIRFSVENWARSYGSIYFEKALLMRFRDESICSSIVHLSEISPYIKERLSDTVLVISRDHVQTVTDVLKDTGYQPEIFGEPSEDTTLSADTFRPTAIQDILNDMRMPVIHSNFIIPDDLINNGQT